MQRQKNRNQRELRRKCDDGFFWCGPDLYIHYVFVDDDLTEVWITRDSFGQSRFVCTVLSLGRTESELFDQMSEETRDQILSVANEHLTYGRETIVREGDGYAFEYK